MSKLVLTLPALYKDNSLQKEIIRHNLSAQRSSKLSKQLEKTQKHRRYLSNLIMKEHKKKETVEKIQAEISNRTTILENMNKAALLIQQRTKELKIKHELEDNDIHTLQSKMQVYLSDLSNLSYHTFWNLGYAAEYASNLIKKSYKRYKFRQKLERIRKVYKIVAKNKKTICRMNLRKFMRVFVSKQRIESAIEQKVHEDQLKKLKIIRSRLAMISLQLFWKSNRITYRKFLYKVAKYKRALNRAQGRFLSVDLAGSEIPSYVSTPKNEEILQPIVKEPDFEAVRLAQLRLIKEREERINNGLIAYNVKRFKQRKFPPLAMISVDDSKKNGALGLTTRGASRLGLSSKTISYCVDGIGKSNRSIGTISTRSTSNHGKVFRFW